MQILTNKELLVPLVLIAFVVFGKFLKETKFIDNKYIPVVLTGVGGLLGVIFFDDTDYVLAMLGLGGFSNNLHQIAKGFKQEDKENGTIRK